MKELHRKLAMEYIEELFEKLEAIGMTDEEIKETVNDWQKEEK